MNDEARKNDESIADDPAAAAGGARTPSSAEALDESSEEEAPPRVSYSDPVTADDLSELDKARADLLDSADSMVDRSTLKVMRGKRREANTWGRYAGLGIQLAASIGILTYAGIYADKHFDTGQTFTIIGALAGTFGGMYSVIATANKETRREAERKKAEKAAREAQERPQA